MELEMYLNEMKILVFQKESKLKKGNRLTVNNRQIEVEDEVNSLGVTFQSSGGWNRQKLKKVAGGNQTLVAMHKCLVRILDTRVKTIRNVCGMSSESRTVNAIDMWGLHGEWADHSGRTV
jgi:hypothetical protein